MKNKFIFATAIIASLTFNVKEAMANTDFNQELSDYSNQFVVSDFSNIRAFNEIMLFCSGVPSNEDELSEWLSKHAYDEDLNIQAMNDSFLDCKEVTRIPLDDL